MKSLADYYNARATAMDENAFLEQVGHTERGTAITDAQFESMVAEICALSELKAEDDLLELCCGNGVITSQLAKRVRTVVGIDFSSSLIEIARKNHPANNLRYEVRNALELGALRNPDGGKFTKVIMHAALQHFREDEFERLIQGILSVCAAKPTMVFGYILEKGKETLFYDTPKRKLTSIARRLTGRDVIGTWWDRGLIARTCVNQGLQCAFHDVDGGSDASLYRFDVKIW